MNQINVELIKSSEVVPENIADIYNNIEETG